MVMVNRLYFIFTWKALVSLTIIFENDCDQLIPEEYRPFVEYSFKYLLPPATNTSCERLFSKV